MIIKNAKELYKADDLPVQVKDDIKAMLDILDTAYGKDRDVFSDDGGFIAVIDDVGMCSKTLESYNLNIKTDVFEYEQLIGGYVKRLYILSSDFSIIAYIKEGLL